jgi:hypothetical protein
MKQTYFDNKQDSIFQAAYNVLTEGKYIQEASGQSDPDITVWTKKGPHNYDNFLAANEDRIGKPMIDSGIKASADKDNRNGQPVEGVIYCGSGCVTFDRRGEKAFKQISAGLINSDDGSGVGWSGWKSSTSDVSIYAKDAVQFNAFVKAANVAAKF